MISYREAFYILLVLALILLSLLFYENRTFSKKITEHDYQILELRKENILSMK